MKKLPLSKQLIANNKVHDRSLPVECTHKKPTNKHTGVEVAKQLGVNQGSMSITIPIARKTNTNKHKIRRDIDHPIRQHPEPTPHTLVEDII